MERHISHQNEGVQGERDQTSGAQIPNPRECQVKITIQTDALPD